MNTDQKLNILSDEAIMKAMQSGRLEDCRLLYERYKRPLLAYFYNNLGRKARSEDLVQMVFERVIRYRKNYHGTGSFRSWLFSIARNALKDEWKRQQRSPLTAIRPEENGRLDDGPNAEQKLIQEQRMDLLQKAINRLPAEKRELLSMIKLQGKKYKEVAALYGMNESTLKVQLFRIVKELKAYMESINASTHY